MREKSVFCAKAIICYHLRLLSHVFAVVAQLFPRLGQTAWRRKNDHAVTKE